MAKTAPCKNCLERCVGCHAWCDLYLTWQKEHEVDKVKEHNDAVRRINVHAQHVRERWLKKQK